MKFQLGKGPKLWGIIGGFILFGLIVLALYLTDPEWAKLP